MWNFQYNWAWIWEGNEVNKLQVCSEKFTFTIHTALLVMEIGVIDIWYMDFARDGWQIMLFTTIRKLKDCSGCLIKGGLVNGNQIN